MWKWLLLVIFCSLVLVLVIFLSSNPVLSVICLIFIYILGSMTLYCYSLEFFGYIYLIVYVGVILVLFLLIVMLTRTSVLSKIYLFNSISVLLILMILFVLLWLLGKELLLWLCLDGYIILLVGPFGDIVFEFFDFYLGLIELVELGEDLVRKLGAILYSDYFFFVILGLLLLLIGCIIVSIWLKRRLRKGRGFVSKREGSSRDVFFGTR